MVSNTLIHILLYLALIIVGIILENRRTWVLGKLSALWAEIKTKE